MSRDYCGFENEDSQTAFLAGVVDVLSDNLSTVCDFVHTLDADIFYVKNEDISSLNSAVKKRLHSYNEKYGENMSYEEIESLDLKLKKIECNVDSRFLYGQIEAFSSSPNLKEAIDEFLRSLEWYLRKPVCIYSPVKRDKNIDILARMYLYMAYDYFFISYGEYVVLFIIGSVE